MTTDVLVRVDILARNKEKTHDLIEVKSSTSLKPEHLPDIAIQRHVVAGSGVKLRRSCIAHINADYVRAGDVVSDGAVADETAVPHEVPQPDVIVDGDVFTVRADEIIFDVGQPHD